MDYKFNRYIAYEISFLKLNFSHKHKNTYTTDINTHRHKNTYKHINV